MWHSEGFTRQMLYGAQTPTTTPTTTPFTSQIPTLTVKKHPEGSRPAIVSTMRFPAFGAHVVRSFIEYHRKVGFVRLYLFFDDPTDSAIQIAQTYSKSLVTVIVHDDALAQQWKECYSYHNLAPFVADEVQARQHLNCEIAMKLALLENQNQIQIQNQIDWLLHIDSDELFYTKETSVLGHFQSLWNDDVYQMTYMNHEGIPEGNININEDGIDYFQNITLFRRHHLDVPLNSPSKKAMEYWESRTQHGQYMLCYDNGKSACRVVEGARPASVHSWILPSSTTTKITMQSKTALVDPRNLNLQKIRKCSDPCILHYVVCGLPWLKSKYEMLGAFQDAWFGGRLPIAPSFHLDARDALLNNNIESIWNSQVIFQNEEILQEHLDTGVLLRLVKPREVLLGRKEVVLAKATLKKGESKKKNQTQSEGERKARDGDKSDTSKAKNMQDNPLKKETTADEFTYSKAWMMSQAVQNFL
jgi:hypothetical protein